MTDYLTDFVQESEERITELNNALLTLERDPDDEEAMENIFRIAHTLKGNCGAMGLDSASDLAHAIEDLLDAVRGDEIDVTPELMDVVFDGVDELETMVDEVAATGEIETDPSATIEALRTHLEDAENEAAAGLVAPAADEIDDVCSRFEPPADDGHDVYLARLAIAEREGVNNGELVVDALIDAFDLIGTDPPRETIEAAAYGDRFDAVFATAVGESAISSGLEPVEEVADFELVNVSDRFETADETAPTADRLADAAERADDISPEEAQDLEVDDLLDEFTEFDDLDEMVEDVGDDELEVFENMGEAGSFDDLLDEDDLDDEPGEPPETPLDEADDAATPDSGSATDDGPGATETDSASEDDVDDASAVFDELKDEVEMVGFDELQDELAELEFDEFDDEDEVDMDELLGEDVDDDAFLDGEEPSESAVDDILVDAESNEDLAADAADDEGETDAPDVDTTAADGVDDDSVADDSGLEPATEPDEEAIVDDDDVVAAETDDDVTAAETDDDVVAAETDDDVVAAETDDDVVAADDVAGGPDDEIETGPAPDPVDEPEPTDSKPDVSSDDPVDTTTAEDDTTADEAPVEDVAAADSTPDDAVTDEQIVDEPVADDTVSDDTDETDADEVDGDAVDDGTGAADTADAEPIGDADESPAATDATETESTDDATVESDDLALETDDTGFETGDGAESDDGLESAADVGEEDTATDDDAVTGGSFGADVEAEFEPTAAFGDDLEETTDDSDPFDDEDEGTFDDDSFDDDAAESDESDADDDFESEFEDDLSEDLDDEAFAGTDEFDTGGVDFDSSAASGENDDSSGPPAASFGDDTTDSDADADDESAVRIIDEPEFERPEIDVPESSDRPDADAETDEIQSVRVDVEQIDSLLTLVEGLVTSRVRLRHAAEADDDGDAALETELDALSDLTTDLQETVMDIRLVPLETVTNRLPRVVRDIARDQDKEVEFEMTGEDVELDRSILDRIGDPLIHLVRNAVDHGIEPPKDREEAGKPREGAVEVHADRARDRVTITVEDDGAGLDPDRLRSEAVAADVLDEEEAAAMSDDETYDLIFHPGLSTVDEVTDVSGRGVGMDVVKRTVEDLDGTVAIDSEEGEGTTVTMRLPVTVAIDEILFVESGGEEFGVPTKAVQDIESAGAIETVDGESVLPGDGSDYPVVSLADALETPTPGANGDGMVIRIRGEVRDVALHCDHVRGQQEVVVKPFEGFMSGMPGISGATVRGRGEVVNILDVTTL
ncbi:chemotaxis protein CheA [Natrinema sp. DC36]|uniref:chemotaxis protein CheA n=1 Tax=Natrinema sp. DC36 TaxID=2878680 RepID=UPI001CEFFE1E|nr:chemotaxis protein CheA [Natrinema sp. DC36]